jgi:hypothetical protein
MRLIIGHIIKNSLFFNELRLSLMNNNWIDANRNKKVINNLKFTNKA